MKKYRSLKLQYPEFISLNQLYQICKISKRSAHYLVHNGIIPCTENDNKTWRYKIALDDVITYLHRREQLGSMIPQGASNNKKAYRKPAAPRPQIDIGTSPKKLTSYFRSIFKECPDMITTRNIAEMTGLPAGTISKFIRIGVLIAVPGYMPYIITKSSFFEFLTTPEFLQYKSPSKDFQKIIAGFEIWTNKK